MAFKKKFGIDMSEQVRQVLADMSPEERVQAEAMISKLARNPYLANPIGGGPLKVVWTKIRWFFREVRLFFTKKDKK